MNQSTRWVAVLLTVASVTLAAFDASAAAKAKKGKGPRTPAAVTDAANQIMVRVRLAELAPVSYARIRWHWGGGGLGVGKEPMVGELTAVPPQAAPSAALVGGEPDFLAEKDKKGDAVWVKKGVWLKPVPLGYFGLKSFPFLNFTIMGKSIQKGRGGARSVERSALEFELSYQGKVIKTFTETAPEGALVTVYFPVRDLAPGGAPTPEFIEKVGGLLQYSQRRDQFLEELPWAKRPLPKRYAIVTDCMGYHEGAGGYAAHTSNKEVILAELRAVRQLGVNGLRGSTEFLKDMMVGNQGIGKEFTRIRIGGAGGFLVPTPGAQVAGAGCPYHPATIAGHAEKVRDAVGRVMDRSHELPTEECWLLTIDEIGAYYSSVRHTEHLSTCDYCGQAFREFVKREGYAPADFGVKDWSGVKPAGAYLAGLAAQGYQPPKRKKKGKAAAPAKAAAAPTTEEPSSGEERESANDDDVSGQLRAEKDGYKLPISDRGWALARYLTREFNRETTANLFAAQRQAFAAENEKKSKALAEGKSDSPAAKQPWMYSYALRRSSYIMGGDTLDYFDFYRKADNAFMYETSNRDPRAWQWDSLMCDVGRILSEKFGTRFGPCIKPHRGAPTQRALAAVSRNAKLIYWYTYGPNWAKGDSFSGQLHCLRKASWTARLLGAAEDVIYDGQWAVPAEVALVRLRLSESFEGSTSWENGKWIYTALTHAHIPVDPLNDSLLLSEDLSRYKVIYLSGTNIRKAAADKLTQWVQNGGTLYISGGSVVKDEGNQPLASLLPVVGLKSRKNMEEWRKMFRYGSVALGKLKEITTDSPPSITVTGSGDLSGRIPVLAGREVLQPEQDTTVLARYSDGGAAVTQHAYGKGQVFVVGFYAGVEYSADVQEATYDMAKDFKPEKRQYVALAALRAGVKPVVDAAQPIVEGVLIKNPKSGRRAAILMNWAYQVDENRLKTGSEFTNLVVNIRGAGKVTKVWSTALEKELAFKQNGEDVAAMIPTMADGEILLID